MSNETSNTMSVVLGNGDGTFQAPVGYATGVEPTGIAVGDFNGDGKLDVVVTNFGSYSGNTVSIFLGNGDGTFQPRVDYSTANEPISVVVADFNRDGKPDLAVACESFNISVLLGNGDGTFQNHVDYMAGGPYSVVAADFNGDGKLDLAVASLIVTQASTVLILDGNGDGTFQPAIGYATGLNPYALAVGDFNGDGAPDIIAEAPFQSVAVLLNEGGTVVALTSSPNPSKVGQPVTFTVTVAASLSVANQPGPTGKISLRDDSTILAELNLQQGSAQFTTSSLNAGKHRIVASYSGDSHFNPNQSSPITQQVQSKASN